MLEELAVLYDADPPRANRGKLAAEFPSIFITFDGDADPHLLASDWTRRDFDLWAFDLLVDELARDPFTLSIRDDRHDDDARMREGFPLAVLNRCQRIIDRRNRHSQGQLFSRVLQKHRALHDLEKPLVRADYNHARDAWQWLLRLEPEASISLQIAALFHDIERLASEADGRVEQLASDYQAFKDNHARRGAELTHDVLASAGVAEHVCARVAELIAAHERQSDDAEVALLNDADALSFFSFNSPGYADYFGPEQTAKKVAYTLNRMTPRARRKLECVQLRDDVRAQLNQCMSER
ncbi:MAG: DUF4202 family protein [Thermoanaerobaculia bacterium]